MGDDLEIMIEEVRMTVVMSAPRRIQGVNRMDRMRSEDINQQLRKEGILDLIRRRQENWK